jgi:hypothetical protein
VNYRKARGSTSHTYDGEWRISFNCAIVVGAIFDKSRH